MSLFGGFKPNGEKPKFPVLQPNQVFQYMVVQNKELDLQLMADIVNFVN